MRSLLRKSFILLSLLSLIGVGVGAAYARGQQGDDCPPGSTDPDCKKAPPVPHP